MFWQGEPFRGAIVSRREIKGEVVYAIAFLSESQYGPLMREGLPVIQMAVARQIDIFIEADNAYNARSSKGRAFARTFVLGRKRKDSPVEIVSIQ